MAILGQGKVNTHPCTPEDANRNWQVVNTFINTVNEFMEDSGAVDTFTVLVTEDDTTASVLHDAIEDNGTYTADSDVIVSSVTVGAADTDQTERFFVDMSNSHGGAGTWALCVVNGTNTWVDTSTFVADAFTVKITTNDTTAGFLHDSMVNTATYDADPDIPIYAAVNTPAGNEKLQLFIDASAITAYSGTGTHALCEVNGVPTFVDLDAFVGSGVTEGTYIDISAGQVSVDLTEVSGYDAGDNSQDLIHESGTIKWTYHKVSVTADDSTPSVLHAAIKDVDGTDPYSTTQDAAIYGETDGAAGTNQLERFYFNSSKIPGWDAGANQVLAHLAGTLQWIDLGECA